MFSKEEQQIKLYSSYRCSQWQKKNIAAFCHHYIIFYSQEFNIRNYAFNETGKKIPYKMQGAWCEDCVDILVEIYDNCRAHFIKMKPCQLFEKVSEKRHLLFTLRRYDWANIYQIEMTTRLATDTDIKGILSSTWMIKEGISFPDDSSMWY